MKKLAPRSRKRKRTLRSSCWQCPKQFEVEIAKLGKAWKLEITGELALGAKCAPVLAQEYLEDFADLFANETGRELDHQGCQLVYAIFLDHLSSQLSPTTIYRAFFNKYLHKYIVTVERLAKIGQQHAPGGVLTSRPKPLRGNPILSYRWSSPEKVKLGLFAGIENAYLESTAAIGRKPIRWIVETPKRWALRDLGATVENVGLATGAYNLRDDWETFLNSYEAKAPTYEKVRDAIFSGKTDLPRSATAPASTRVAM